MRTFNVNTAFVVGSTQVTAKRYSVNDGYLDFYNEAGSLVATFATGTWYDVRLQGEEVEDK